MLTLIIETSTERGVVAILDEQTILFQHDLPYGYQNSQYLLPAIRDGLIQINLKAKDLNLIIAGVGPGSYTGIRVGAITAKSIAYACKLPLVGISTLQTFIPIEDGPFAAIIDAKISGVYLLKGIKKDQVIEYTSPPYLCPLEDLESELSGIKNLVTPDNKRILPIISKSFPGNSWKWLEVNPSVLHLAKMGLQKYESGEFSLTGHLDLLYLRKTQAEIERVQRLGI